MMGYLKTAIEVMMACFAVIGFYSLSRMLAMRLYGSRRLVLAVEILTEEALCEAEDAIRDALSQFLLVPSGRVCVLTTEQWQRDPTLVALVHKYGVEVRVIAADEI